MIPLGSLSLLLGGGPVRTLSIMFPCPPPRVGMVPVMAPVNLFWDKMADCPVNPAPDSFTLILLCLKLQCQNASFTTPVSPVAVSCPGVLCEPVVEVVRDVSSWFSPWFLFKILHIQLYSCLTVYSSYSIKVLHHVIYFNIFLSLFLSLTSTANFPFFSL